MGFEVSWNGIMKAGIVEARIGYDDDDPKSKRLTATVKARSVGPARLLWKFDGTHESIIDRATLRPISSRLTEEERGGSVRHEADFGAKLVLCNRTKLSGGDETASSRVYNIGAVYDIISAALFVRSMAFERDGQSIDVVVFPFGDPYLVDISLEGREALKVNADRVEALRLDATLRKIQKDGMLRASDDRVKGIKAWLSDNALRLPLEIRADTIAGTVRLALVSHELS